MLYYLEKFCRICIQTGGKLTDIDSKDHDSVKFSDKLKACTQMVITRESLSTQICSSCVHKLRISYQFQNMCKKSTAILQRYLTELLSMSDDFTADKFLNSELTISTATLPKPRRKRVGKDERCSLLKKLLSRITQEQIVHNIHINGLAKLCDRIPPAIADVQTPSDYSVMQNSLVLADKPDVEIIPLPRTRLIHKSDDEIKTSSLKNLLHFTRDFDFGYDISAIGHHCNNFDLTPLERLAKFTQSFFYDHFGDYRETILHVRDSPDFDSSDDEAMFDRCAAGEELLEGVKEEVVIVEPDLSLKKEMDYEEEPCCDYEDDQDDETYDFSSRFVQACYDNGDELKHECNDKLKPINQECVSLINRAPEANYVAQNSHLAEIIPITQPIFMSQHNYSPPQTNFHTAPAFLEHSDFLKQLQDSPLNFKRHRTLSPYSVKCRTRGNPFINPQLKKQFQTRNFKCGTCSRRFKSPGYLKAHCSKLRH